MNPQPKPQKEKKKNKKYIKTRSDTDLARLIATGDSLAQDIIHMISGEQCMAILEDGSRCKGMPVEDHHIILKSQSLFTRLLIYNHIGLCNSCHDHSRKSDMDEKIKRSIGEPRWNYLQTLSKHILTSVSKTEYIKCSVLELKLIKATLLTNLVHTYPAQAAPVLREVVDEAAEIPIDIYEKTG
jgi:hypothetical protein